MKLRSGATASSGGTVVSAEATLEGAQRGYTIAGAGGENAAAWSTIEGGQGDVIAGTFEINGRRVALSVAIGRDDRALPGQSTTTLIGRAAVRGR